MMKDRFVMRLAIAAAMTLTLAVGSAAAVTLAETPAAPQASPAATPAPSAPAPQATPAAAKVDPGARSEGIVDLFAKGDYDAIYATFDATMKTALPKEQLKAVWEQVVGQVGPYKSHGKAEVTSAMGMSMVIVPMTFEKAELIAQVSWNDKGEMAGLYFKPAPPPKQSYVAPAYVVPGAFAESELVAGSPGWPLPATLAMPVGSGPFPAAVLVHGSGPNGRDECVGAACVFRDLACGLASRGIAVLRYDKRTKVHAERLMREKTPLTLDDEVVDDALAAVALLRRTPKIDPARIFVIGHSLGAMMAPEIARRDPRLAGVVAMAGPTRSFEVLVHDQTDWILAHSGVTEDQRKTQLAQIDAELAKTSAASAPKRAAAPATTPTPTVAAQAVVASSSPEAPGERPAAASGEDLILGAPPSYWASLHAYRPVETAKQIRLPFLILQGERDYQVTMKDLEGWKGALAGRPNVDIRSYPKLNHLFIEGDGPSVPAEYDKPGHVSEVVVNDLTTWMKHQRPGKPA